MRSNNYYQQRFIEKSKKIYGDRYDYSKVNYVDKSTKVIIICPLHGEFEQTPSNHYRAKCRNCSIEDLRTPLKDFIEKANIVHNHKYNYSLVKYKNNKDKVEIICPVHGVFSQVLKNHLKTNGCPRCSKERVSDARTKTQEKFIKEAVKAHGSEYDYSLVNYKYSLENVTIVCKKHGKFEQIAVSHIRGAGCPTCSKEQSAIKRTKTTEEFIEQANQLHKNKYDYSKVDYVNSKSKVIISCPVHGEFKQTPFSHLKSFGCSKCGRKRSSEYRALNPPGWSYSSWEKLAEKSKFFDNYKVYILRCWNDTEQFYKIGRTFRTVKERFRKTMDLPYNYEIVYIQIFDNARECCEKEQKMKNNNKQNRYFPSIYFGGNHECFSKVNKK